MAPNTKGTPVTAAPVDRPTDSQALAQEIETYRRELPRLLAEGEAGRFALIKGDEVLSVWDTQRDGIQAGRDRFGLQPICVKRVDPRDVEHFAQLEAQTKE